MAGPAWLLYQDRDRVLFRRRKPDGLLERVRTYLRPRRSFSRSLRLSDRAGTAGREVPAQ
ncbi:hypothetical protein BQ8794_60073 [Mesorhizobium prunaredense]|uniref:Uncharacterized protein n=1 Tax=Mesorhizobium prunaredense TaxID=1631249 RepID=A0A1R3VIR6_9HYPH|nr:hypothetical protein BQ8794_60073 [Mesorhizobium prunaredense]